LIYGGRKTREKGERLLRKRKRNTGKRVWRCRVSQLLCMKIEI